MADKNISVCGSDCAECSFVQMCGGCSERGGKVFHCPEGQECAVYHCCVSEHGFSSCIKCGEIPCGIWRKTRDPNFSDDEFEKNIADRIAVLRGL